MAGSILVGLLNGPQSTMILVIRTLKKGPLILGNPHICQRVTAKHVKQGARFIKAGACHGTHSDAAATTAPSWWKRIPMFEGFEFRADGYVLRCLGYSLWGSRRLSLNPEAVLQLQVKSATCQFCRPRMMTASSPSFCVFWPPQGTKDRDSGTLVGQRYGCTVDRIKRMQVN